MNSFKFTSNESYIISEMMNKGQENRFPQIVLARRLLVNIVKVPYSVMDDDSFIINYNYIKFKSKTHKFMIGDKRKSYTLLESTDKEYLDQHNGVNYVHSLDSYVVRNIVNRFDNDILVIHDSFGVPIHLIDKLRYNIRNEYKNIYFKI